MCGIIWVYNLDQSQGRDLPKIALNLLKWNRNRGQEWYGLSVITQQDGIKTFKFSDVYDRDIYSGIHDTTSEIIGIIGHARYPTSWWTDNSWEYIQPFEIQEWKDFTFAFNGNIVNADDIASSMESESSMTFQKPILDTKVLEQMIRNQIQKWEMDTKRILENINNVIDGACNIVLASADGSFTLTKDRWWFRPLSFAQKEGMMLFSSESSALFKEAVHDDDLKFVNTGESVKYNSKVGNLIQAPMDLDVPFEKSRCFFETVYFADSKTKLWKEPSSNHRYRLGQNLAQRDSNVFCREDTVVVDVPASSRDSAEWFAETLDLRHFQTAITKNPVFDKRSFIWATKQQRKQILENKYIFNPELRAFIEWKKLVIVDDSIVRGSTLEFLIKKIQEFYNPSEIHIRIPSPPITGPCYYAINLKHPNELLARKFFEDTNNPTLEEFDNLATYFGASSIRYVNKEEMIWALRVDVKDMCLWCITGKYPTPCWQKKFERQLQEKDLV